jgi:hypothetical protein
LTLCSIVFVHGLRGHPRGTWEADVEAAAVSASASNSNNDTTKQSKGLRSFFKRRTAQTVRSPLTSTEQAQAPSLLPSSKVFWPEDYLATDVPQAQIWTYGYNADVIGGLFQANNKNSISQHGQDLSVRLEREVGNGVQH